MSDKRLFLGTAMAVVLALIPISARAAPVTLRWYGHAFFVLTSSRGVRVALDPVGDIGYPKPKESLDVVTVSHEHSDHNRVEA